MTRRSRVSTSTPSSSSSSSSSSSATSFSSSSSSPSSLSTRAAEQPLRSARRTRRSVDRNAQSSSSLQAEGRTDEPSRKRSRVGTSTRHRSSSQSRSNAFFGATGSPQKARRKRTKVKTTAATSSSRELHRGGQTESSEVEDKSKEENDSADDDSSSEIDSSSDEGSADDDSENEPSPTSTSTSDPRVDAEAKALKSKKRKRRSRKIKSSSTKEAAKETKKRKKAKPPTAAKKAPSVPPSIDPITLEAIPPRHLFIIKRENGTEGHFDAVSLAAYIVASGDFTDPLTRISLSMQDLERLDATVKVLNEKKTSKKTSNTQRASVVEAFKATSHYKSARCQRDALLGLERYLGEQVAEVLATIEEVNDGKLETNEAEQVILTEILPSFQHNFEILARADALLARQSLSQYLSFVRGPPNRATRNRCGFRDFILAVLQVFESIVQSPHSQHVLSSSQINLLLRTAPTSSTSSSSRANELSTRQI